MTTSHGTVARKVRQYQGTAALLFVVTCGLLVGCALTPAAKLHLYLPDSLATADGTHERFEAVTQNQVHAALLLRWDSASPGSAPPVSEVLFQSMVERLRLQIEKEIPIKVVTVLEPDLIEPGSGSSRIIQIAQEGSVPYLIVGILSSVEIDSPLSVPLSLESVYVLGTRTENYTLAELALLDGGDGRVLLYAQGRGYMRLDRPDGEQQSNLYPVIQRSEGESPIYPDPVRAEDVLRGVTGREALEQAVHLLKDAWKRKT